MAKILCMTTGLTGILNASFELTNRLLAMGHNVVCASPSDVGNKVSAQGFEYLQLKAVNFDPAPAVPAYQGPMRKPARFIHKLIQVKKRRNQAIKALGMDAFREQLQELKPDLIIADIELHEHIMTLVTAQYKVLLLSQWFSTWDSPGLPPIQSDIIPGQGAEGSAEGMTRSWKQVRSTRWKTFVKKKLTSVYTDRRSILQKYAKESGFPSQWIEKNYWPGPFSYDVLPVISMTAEALEFPHEKRAGLTYVGPMVYTKRKEVVDTATSDVLDKIFAKKQQPGKKLIYCSVSTFSVGDTGFLKKVIEAVQENKDWLLLISLGAKLSPEALGNIPENVFVCRQVPQLQVLEVADLSINHGGIHTINECLQFKVPMLIYSGKRSDQNGCATRVHYHKLGIMADKDQDSAAKISENIASCLKHPEMLDRMPEVKSERDLEALRNSVKAVLAAKSALNQKGVNR